MNRRVIVSFFLIFSLNAQSNECDTAKFIDCAAKQCVINDLTLSYQTALKLLTCLQQEIQQLPQQNQGVLFQELNAAKTAIEGMYKDNTTTINLYKSRPEPFRGRIVDSQIREGMQAIESKVEQIQNIVKNTQIALGYNKKVEDDKQARLKAAKEAAAFHESMMKLFQDLKPLMVTFNTISADNYSILSDLYKAKNFDATFLPRIEKVTQEWQKITQQFSAVYKNNNQKIAIDDITNYVVLSIRALIYFYSNIIEMQLTKMNRMKRDEAYPFYSSLVTQLLGTGKGTNVQGFGYDAIIKNLINTYFKDNQADLNKVYLQAKVNLTYNRYKSLLNGLVARGVDPEKQLDYAEKFYALIMSDNSVLPENQQAADAQAASSTIALLYVLSAQSQVKKMRLGQDTKPMREKAITYYKKAASYYRSAGDSSNAQNCTVLFTNLTQAAVLFDQAETAKKSNDLKTAIDLYTQAQAAFQNSGDIIDASTTSLKLLDVEAQYYLDQAKSVTNDLAKKAATLTDAIVNSGSPAVPDKNAAFTTLIATLNESNKTIFQYYVNIVAGYQTRADQDSLAAPAQDVIARIHVLNLSASVLQKVIEANTLLVNGDAFLKVGSISEAQEAYKSAIVLYQLADAFYAKNPQIAEFIPLYPSTLTANKSWSYALIAQRHISKMFVELAAKTTDMVLAFHYYTNAQFRNHYLTQEMQQFIDESLKKITAQAGVIQEIYAAAQKAEKDALVLTSDAWKPTMSIGYSSSADSAWEQVLRYYSSLYRSGDAQIRADYLKAIDEYANAFALNVPLEYYPALGTSLIRYHLYVLAMIESDEKQAEAVLKVIEDLITPFFDNVESLIADVNNTSLIVSSSGNQEKVLEWQQRFDQALIRQEDVLDELAVTMSPDQRKILLLLEKTTDAQDGITNTFLPTKKSVVLVNPALKLADVTKLLGDYYFQKKDYISAYANYSDAQNQYKNGNRYDKVMGLQQQFDATKTLYYGSLYRDSVLPQGSIKFDSFTAPASYDLKLYKQPVPKIVSDQFPSAEILKSYSKEQVSQFTVSVMIDMYLYWWIRSALCLTVITIKDVNRCDAQYAKLIDVMKSSLEKEKDAVIAAVKTILDDEDDQKNCVNIIMNAQQFRKELNDRVAQKKTSFSLEQQKAKDGSLEYVLYELHIPIPQFPMAKIDTTSMFYKGYPSASLFYLWASQLFASGKERFVVNKTSFTPGNQPDLYQAILDKTLELYFSTAYTYQTKIDELKASDAYKKLLAVNKNDMSVKIADYLDLFNGIRDNYQQVSGGMIFYTDNALNQSFIDRNSAKGKKINALVANLCKQLGDELSVFLIGDPRSKDYHVMVLDSISHTYSNAIFNYGYDSNVYKKYAEFCKKGGDVLVQQGMYFVSSRLYVKAEKGYRSITPQTPELSSLADSVALMRLQNVCKAATINIGQYLDARLNGVTIKNDDGTTTKKSLDDIIVLYNKTLRQGGGAEDVIGLDAQSTKALNDLKSGLLDALIFYSGSVVGSKTPYVAGFGLLAQSSAPTSADKSSDAVIKSASQLVNDFMQKNNLIFKNEISVDAVTTVTLGLKRPNFPDGKTIADVIQKGFDSMVKSVDSSSVEKSAAYQALSTWCSLLYTSFASLFINDFLGGMPTKPEDLVAAVNNLNGSIDTETNAMNSATWQFFDSDSNT